MKCSRDGQSVGRLILGGVDMSDISASEPTVFVGMVEGAATIVVRGSAYTY